MKLLQLVDVSKVIDGTTVLTHISMELKAGSAYGIVGKNGSGKTMLLRVIAGLVKPTEGKICAYGIKTANSQDVKDVFVLHQDASVFPNVGIIIENAGLYPEFTGVQNLKFLAAIHGKIGEKEIRDVITHVGLDPNDKRPIRKYSLGMRQRILLAQAIMEKPSLLLLDEPGNALDKSGIMMLKDIVQEAKETNAIVLISSHDMDLVNDLCDSVYHMEDGKITDSESGVSI